MQVGVAFAVATAFRSTMAGVPGGAALGVPGLGDLQLTRVTAGRALRAEPGIRCYCGGRGVVSGSHRCRAQQRPAPESPATARGGPGDGNKDGASSTN